MKRTLTFITFLLLFLPVWKECTGKKAVPEENSDIEVIDTIDVSCSEIDEISTNDSITAVEMSPQTTTFDNFLKIFEWDEDCQSGYKQIWLGGEFLKKIVKEEKKNAESKNDTKNTEDGKVNSIEDIFSVFLYYSLVFSFAIYFLISIALSIFSFTKKRKVFIWLSGINLFIIILSYISYFYYASDYYQIKFGFYLLIINSLLIFSSNFIKKRRNDLQTLHLKNDTCE